MIDQAVACSVSTLIVLLVLNAFRAVENQISEAPELRSISCEAESLPAIRRSTWYYLLEPSEASAFQPSPSPRIESTAYQSSLARREWVAASVK